MKWLCVILVAVPLSGCGMVQRIENEKRVKEIAAAVDADMDICTNRYPFGQKTIVSRARCIAAAQRKLTPIHPAPDLLEVRSAQFVLLAEQWEAGKITQSQFELQASQANAAMVAEAERRGLARRSVAAQEDSAAAAWRASAPVSCTRSGNTVNCF